MDGRLRPAVRFVAVAGLLGAAACAGSTGPTTPSAPIAPIPIMGSSRLTASQLVTWMNGRQPTLSGTYAATEPLEVLAAYYIEEGAAEGVTGDVAFIQSIIETGWFRFNGTVPASSNNFSGLGATDTNPAPAIFTDARTGVRAQIQHLRAYADASAVSCSMPPLHNPCVDGRFNLVSPKGKAPNWNQLGSGNWATAQNYGADIVALYEAARIFGSR